MLKLHYHGHSCWEIEDGTHRVVIDPFLTGNPLADVKPEAFTKLDAVIVTHGNGPQVGAAVLRSERASTQVYRQPLDVCVAETQGEIGYILEQSLIEATAAAGLDVTVATIVRVTSSCTDSTFSISRS